MEFQENLQSFDGGYKSSYQAAEKAADVSILHIVVKINLTGNSFSKLRKAENVHDEAEKQQNLARQHPIKKDGL